MKALNFEDIIIKMDMDEITRNYIEFQKLFHSTICITGATGMLASYLILAFLYMNEKYNADIKILAVVRNMDKAEKMFHKFLEHKELVLFCADITKPLEIDENIDYIIHAASLASPQYYGSNPVETILPNTVATYHLLELAKKQKSFGSFLFFSSGSIYGETLAQESIKEVDLGGLDYLNNGNSYAESKRCGEMLCHAYFSEYGVSTLMARIHHTYGPTMDIVNDKRAFSAFVNNVVNDRDIVLTSNGRAKRAFCYITDTIRALLSLLVGGQGGECYNVGNPYEYISVNEMANIIIEVLHKNLKLVHTNADSETSLSPEADSRTVPVNIDKIKNLGWEPQVTSREGFARVLSYFENKK